MYKFDYHLLSNILYKYMLYMDETNIFKLIIDTMIICQNNKFDNKKDVCMNITQKNIS